MVAEEVRKLAEQSQEAAKQIAGLIVRFKVILLRLLIPWNQEPGKSERELRL